MQLRYVIGRRAEGSGDSCAPILKSDLPAGVLLGGLGSRSTERRGSNGAASGFWLACGELCGVTVCGLRGSECWSWSQMTRSDREAQPLLSLNDASMDGATYGGAGA